MLGKLFKYEVKSLARVCGLMYLVAAIFTGLMMMYETLFKNIRIQNAWLRRFADMIVSMGGIGYLLVLVAVNLLTLVYLIYRFYQTMVSDQGYLTHTLPVTTGQLVFVKAVTAFCFRVLSFLVSGCSILLVVVSTGDWNKVVQGISDFRAWGDDVRIWGGPFAVFVILGVLICIFSGLFKILEYYMCLSAGNLFNSHKLAGAVVVYLVFNVVLGTAKTFVMVTGMYAAEKWSDQFFRVDDVDAVMQQVIGGIDVYMAAGVLLLAAGCGGLFAVCRYILKNRLNLA
jgi:hypothetical protein